MNEINYLNDSHKSVVEKYLLRLKKIMYFATENTESGKYQDFFDILNTVYRYSNNFYETMLKREDNNATQEFIFLIPNMTFYSCIGYLTALKNVTNIEQIRDALEKITVVTEDATSDLADIVIDDYENKKILREIEELQLTKN